jgi:hypothetical protein
MDASPHLTIGYELSGESRMQVQEGLSLTYELKGLRYRELAICMGGMRRVNIGDPC